MHVESSGASSVHALELRRQIVGRALGRVDERQRAPRLQVARRHRHHLLELRERRVELARLPQDLAEHLAHLDVVGPQLERLLAPAPAPARGCPRRDTAAPAPPSPVVARLEIERVRVLPRRAAPLAADRGTTSAEHAMRLGELGIDEVHLA